MRGAEREWEGTEKWEGRDGRRAGGIRRVYMYIYFLIKLPNGFAGQFVFELYSSSYQKQVWSTRPIIRDN